MHMTDALLSPAVGTAFWAGTLASIAYSSRKLKEGIDEKLIPLMGVLGAFIFAAQMVNFTIPGTGSSGHLGGGMILAVILGPYAAFLAIASVLTVQALFFADGGILALGCNVWNLGVYPCFISYPFIYRAIAGNGQRPKRIAAASMASAIVGLQLGAISVVLQTLLSGRSELPLQPFLSVMLPIHLAIGIVEGFITAGVVNYVRASRPELLEPALLSQPFAQNVSMKKVLLVFLVLAVISGGALSRFSSTHPDGLEWSIGKVYGKPELPDGERGIASALKKLQQEVAIFPDYHSREGMPSDTAESRGASASGILGSIIVLFLILLLGLAVKTLRRKRVPGRGK